MARRPITDELFAQFWQLYPVRKGRQDAERAWSRLTKKDRKAAIEGVQAYVDDCTAHGYAFKYPQGYLSGRRWEDEGAPVIDTSTSRHTDMSKAPNNNNNEEMELW